MPPTKVTARPEIYQIKITLFGTRPPIWRRLLVPSDLTLRSLHDAVQLAMGWQDCHLHDFRIGRERFGSPDPEDRLMGLPSIGNERTVRLFSVLGKVGSKAVYTYDFGDGWEHGIVVEGVGPVEPARAYPICVDGKGHGPPEDCGGVPGYYNLLEAIQNPNHEEHEEMREWIGGDFDPEEFSVDEVNQGLAPLQRRHARTRAQGR